MKLLRKIRNYICYCGIERDEYNAIKKDAYASNFAVWRILHCLMAAVFTLLFVASLPVEMMAVNRVFYLIFAIYSITATLLFLFVLKQESFVAQLFIYLSISMLLLFGALITQNKPTTPATTFFAMLLLTPMFMIDKPFFMAIELGAASTVFSVWMYRVKEFGIWQMDFVNVITFTFVGIVIHIVANSLRIKEFVLTQTIRVQKDTDDMTGLANKGALTGAINAFLTDPARDKGVLLMLDVDRFKAINDTYGHDVGDSVIRQVGAYLDGVFKKGEIVGRFGGDEFIIFIKDSDDPYAAADTARQIIEGIAGYVKLPDETAKVGVSVGIAIYRGEEKNYSEIFKKADVALYQAKADRKSPDTAAEAKGYSFYNE